MLQQSVSATAADKEDAVRIEWNNMSFGCVYTMGCVIAKQTLSRPLIDDEQANGSVTVETD